MSGAANGIGPEPGGNEWREVGERAALRGPPDWVACRPSSRASMKQSCTSNHEFLTTGHAAQPGRDGVALAGRREGTPETNALTHDGCFRRKAGFPVGTKTKESPETLASPVAPGPNTSNLVSNYNSRMYNSNFDAFSPPTSKLACSSIMYNNTFDTADTRVMILMLMLDLSLLCRASIEISAV